MIHQIKQIFHILLNKIRKRKYSCIPALDNILNMISIKSLVIFIVLIMFAEYSKAQSIEYSVKALYIEKFARFTDWKTDLSGEYFVIDVLGESPFEGELEKLAQKIKIKNKPVKINYINDYKEIKECQLLFICASEKSKLPEIIKHIETLNILTIADTPGFCKKGIQVNFYIDNSETIKYEINPTALTKANIIVDIQLLNYGEIIN